MPVDPALPRPPASGQTIHALGSSYSQTAEATREGPPTYPQERPLPSPPPQSPDNWRGERGKEAVGGAATTCLLLSQGGNFPRGDPSEGGRGEEEYQMREEEAYLCLCSPNYLEERMYVLVTHIYI